jgi:hypothetical protein
MTFSNGKPVVAGRFNLWEQYNTPAQLAARLNAMPRDSTSKDGYIFTSFVLLSNFFLTYYHAPTIVIL